LPGIDEACRRDGSTRLTATFRYQGVADMIRPANEKPRRCRRGV